MAKYCPVRLDQVLYQDCVECEDKRKCKVAKMPRSAVGRCERCGKFVDPTYYNHIYLCNSGNSFVSGGFGYVQPGDKRYFGTPASGDSGKTFGFHDIFLCQDCQHEFTSWLRDPRTQQYPEIKVGKGPYNQVVIGIDESYASTGVCVVCDGKIKVVKSYSTGARNRDSNIQAISYRRMLHYWLDNLLSAIEQKLCRDYEYPEKLTEEQIKNVWNGTPIQYYGKAIEPRIVVCFERIRTFSQGHISSSYMIRTGGLVATILDVCSRHGVECYSVDTRAWKKAFCGTSKPATKRNRYGVPDEKWPTVQQCLKMGLKSKIVRYLDEPTRRKRGIFVAKDGRQAYIDHDACDAVGIAMCAIEHPDKLQGESRKGNLEW